MSNKLEQAKAILEGLKCDVSHWADRISMYKDADYKTEETILGQLNEFQKNLHRATEEIRKYQESEGL